MRKLLFLLLTFLSINASAQTSTVDTTAKPSSELRNKIIAESKNGGKLDMWTPIMGHEMDGRQIGDGLIATNREIAIMKWTYHVVNLGVANKTEIIALYEKLKNRKIRQDELVSLNYGYNRGINAIGK